MGRQREGGREGGREEQGERGVTGPAEALAMPPATSSAPVTESPRVSSGVSGREKLAAAPPPAFVGDVGAANTPDLEPRVSSMLMGSVGTEVRRAEWRFAPSEKELLRCRGNRKLPPVGRSRLAAVSGVVSAEISPDGGTMVLRHRWRCSGVIDIF